MKQSNLATKITISVLAVGLIAYLVFYIVRGWQDETVTVPAYSAVIQVGTDASGIVVREETVLSGSGAYVELIPSEGEKVSAGQTVARLYHDASGQATSQAINTLSAEIEQLNYALSSGTDATDTSRLDAAVLDCITDLRSLTASGDLSSLEDSTLNLRTMVFKRDYTYGDHEAAGGLAVLCDEKESELAALKSSLSQVATSVAAPASGVFSGVADGYESLIDPVSVLDMTPSQLSGLLGRDVAAPGGTVGKLITSSTWYFAAILAEEDAKGLLEGRTYTISFSYDWFGQVDMTLEQISDPENGQVVLLFSSRTNLADTTLLRVQTVDIVTQELQGIRIPRRALRVLTETVTDEETGETTETQYTAVYTVVCTQAELQRVNVLYTDENFYLVEPADPDASRRLRAGDEIILNTTGIYDGKVVR